MTCKKIKPYLVRHTRCARGDVDTSRIVEVGTSEDQGRNPPTLEEREDVKNYDERSIDSIALRLLRSNHSRRRQRNSIVLYF